MKVFVGYDPREDITYQVCEHSIKRRNKDVDVVPLKMKLLNTNRSTLNFLILLFIIECFSMF